LRDKYLASDGGPGVYNRFAGGETWRKTQSITPPPKPATATSAEGTPGLVYTILGSGRYSVSHGTVTQGSVVIPSTYNNLPVTFIESDSFRSGLITDVTIPDSVTVIDSYAFAGCGATRVTIQGKILASNFTARAFSGDLRAKYLKEGPGTYTRPDVKSKTWTKQP